MIELGHRYTLNVIKTSNNGVYLDAENLGDVLLPLKFVSDKLSVGDCVEVFLYLDSEDRPVASTQQSRVSVGEFAYLRAIQTTPIGAFLDWGLDKDLLLPFSEQHKKIVEGHSYLVYVYLNKVDGRITASSKIDKYIDEENNHDFKPKQAVDLIIANSTDLGYKAIINHSCWGLLYKAEVFQRLSFGQSVKGYIKNIRPDQKIDLSLQGGQETRDNHSKVIQDYLIAQNGFAAVHDKSDPQLIVELFAMSKSSFKKAIGGLYREGIVRIEKDGIYLLER